jgi:NAD(P)-dependent dehydrogenase (short-subunit alcohol dehydrogenase family)
MQLRDKVILVTGGAVRVGRAICTALAEESVILYCHFNKSRKEAELLRDEISNSGSTIELIQGDLNNINFTKRLIEQIISERGCIDVLVNNAALFYKTPFGRVTEQDWDRLFDLNLKAAFFCAQHAGIQMKKQGNGKIINIGDPSGDRPWPGYIPYALTKAGIVSMTKGLAIALAPNVQVNCVNPGPVMIPESYSTDQRTQAINRTLLRREGAAEDISATVRFLIEGSDYITGAIINVDGGRSIA